MTNELEKQFFDTFGIPRLCTSQVCEHWGDCEACLLYPDFALDYPQITDRILLELICIWNLYCTYTLVPTNYKNIKKYVLEQFLFIDTYNFIVDLPIVKHQVRTLFEEG